MRNQKIYSHCSLLFWPVVYLLTLTGCSTLAKETEPVFDVSEVKTMRLSIQKPTTLYGIALEETDVSARVANNLSEWDYLITAEDTEEYSHALVVIIGTVDEGPTPVGFSYTMGSSDPRAIDFQKTEVLPVTCIMNAKDNPDLVAELNMEVDAKAILRYTKPVINQPEILEQIVNKVSTVCYNLLSELKVPTHGSQLADKEKSPAWAPEFTVENEPAKNVEKDGSPSKTPAGAIPESPRKKVVIKNEGTPVIFTFGHDR